MEVSQFRAIVSAELELGAGLNVLYGPNDLGKSSLALAVKAALLLPGTSSVAEQYVPWQDPDQEPEVVVTFEAEDELWKLTRRFTSADVTLERGDEQGAFRPAAKGKKVDERLRGLLSWGVPESVRGLPTTFLTTALLSAQSEVDAVFSRGLDDDADPSGQAQLSKVLTSLSRDPLVVRVLDAAQDEVDRAFTPQGKRKQSKNSPLARAQSEVERLEAELAQRTQALDEVNELTQSLRGLEREWRDAVAAAEVAEAKAREQGSGDGAAAKALVENAQQALDAWDALHQQRVKLQSGLQALVAQAEVKTKRAHEALAAKKTAAQQVRSLEQELREATRSKADAERAVLRAELNQALSELQLRRADVATRLDAARVGDEAVALRARLERERVALQQQMGEAGTAREAAERDLRLLDGIIAYGQWRMARDAREASVAVRTELTSLIATFDALGAKHVSLEQELSTVTRDLAASRGEVPEARQVETLKRLRRELENAEAALGGGVTLQVRPRSEIRLRSTIDDGVPEEARVKNEQTLEAERRATLQLGDLLELDVIAGAPEKRRDVEHLKKRWKSDAVPVLEKVGLRTLTELDARLDALVELERRHDELTRTAGEAAKERTRLDEKVSALRARLEGAPDEAELEERRARIGGLPHEVLERAWKQLGARWELETSGEHRLASKALQDATARVAKLESDLSRVEASLAQVAKTKSGGDDVASVERALREVDAQLDHARRRLAELDTAASSTSTRTTELARAKDRERAADQDSDEADAALKQVRAAVHEVEGGLKALDAQVTKTSRAALLEKLRQATESLQRASPSGAGVAAKANGARAVADAASQAFSSALGGLQRVGGARVVDALDETKAALARARRDLERLTIEADAWRRLRDAVAGAEQETGSNLGAALAAPVSKAFASLTGQRYQSVRFDSSLRVGAVEVAGAAEPDSATDALDVLSVGTRDHLATLIRLALATQLHAPVVLDDHLVHSDATRMAWFRTALAAAAKQTQVLVITCRPLDYVSDADLPKRGQAVAERGGVRVVDLEQVIRRRVSASR